MRLAAALVVLTSLGSFARAETTTLRLATIAPEGTGWAREVAAFAREVEAGTNGSVRVKVYYSSIAGDEYTVLDRIKREQLDGAIGSESCLRLSPSMRVTRVVGVFQSREESAYVLTRLKPVLDREFAQNGFVNLGEANLGPEVLFTRRPVTSMAELKALRMWIWDLDSSLAEQAPAFGLRVVRRAIEQAGAAYDHDELDGFIAIPAAGLAFQWSTRAGFLEDLRISYRNGCAFFASRALDALPNDARQVVAAAAAKLRARIEEVGRREDEALLGGLFARQGIKPVAVSERFRSEFFDLAQDARRHGAAKFVDDKLLQQVLSWLADYRAMQTLRR